MNKYDELIEMCVREITMVKLKIEGNKIANQNLKLELKNLKRNIKILSKGKKQNGHTK